MVGCFDFFTKMFTPHSQKKDAHEDSLLPPGDQRSPMKVDDIHILLDVLHSIRTNHQQNITPIIESNVIEGKLNPMIEKIDYIYKQFDYLIDHHLEEIEKEREKYRILKLEYDTLFTKIHEVKNEEEVIQNKSEKEVMEEEVMEEEVIQNKSEKEVVEVKSEKEVMEEEVIQNKNEEEVVEVKSEEEVIPVVQEKKKRVYQRKKRS